MSDSSSPAWRATLRRRVGLWAAGMVLWTGAIEARLVMLQVYQHDELQAKADRQRMRTMSASPKRGEILDRNGHVLAYSVDVESIYAVPTDIDDAAGTASKLCAAIEKCTAKGLEALTRRLGQPRAFVWVERKVSPADAKRVAALNLAPVNSVKESRRFYPRRELAAQLLGFVGLDNVGLSGIEAAYDGDIKGKAGTILIQTDARRRAFSRLERSPTAGATLELTIDERLQHIAERELRVGVTASGAAGGMAVIMDPFTGEVLAMANEPTFNPNNFAAAGASRRRNRVVQDTYEPGSTFKLITAAAALEEGLVDPDDLIDTSGGAVRVSRTRVIEDNNHDYGMLSFTDVIAKSSNVGAVSVGLRLGADRLHHYMDRFGFGHRLSPDFPAEAAGIVWDPRHLDQSALASVSMGHQVGVTALQMVAAVSAVANGGTLVEPRVVRAIVQNGRRVPVQPRRIGTAIDADTAAELTLIMEAVVESGTGTRAQIRGYSVAGKTGTANKLVDGQYSSTEFNASFVGFVPSRKPVFAIIVVLDTPRHGSYYGSATAAPVFQRIAQLGLQQFGVTPTLNAPSPVLVARTRPEVPKVAPASLPSLVIDTTAHPSVAPDFRGLSARGVVAALTRIGMRARLSGEGFVIDQQPAPGVPLARGTAFDVRLARWPGEARHPSTLRPAPDRPEPDRGAARSGPAEASLEP